MRFIKNKHNNTIVNLDLVTGIYPRSIEYEAYHQIDFICHSGRIAWVFDKLEDMEDALSKIEVLEV